MASALLIGQQGQVVVPYQGGNVRMSVTVADDNYVIRNMDGGFVHRVPLGKDFAFFVGDTQVFLLAGDTITLAEGVSFSGVLRPPAGEAGADTAPLKLATGTLNTTPENGAIEFDGDEFYATVGGVRYGFVLAGGGSDFPVTGGPMQTDIDMDENEINDCGRLDMTMGGPLDMNGGSVTNATNLSSQAVYATLTGRFDDGAHVKNPATPGGDKIAHHKARGSFSDGEGTQPEVMVGGIAANLTGSGVATAVKGRMATQQMAEWHVSWDAIANGSDGDEITITNLFPYTPDNAERRRNTVPVFHSGAEPPANAYMMVCRPLSESSTTGKLWWLRTGFGNDPVAVTKAHVNGIVFLGFTFSLMTTAPQ